MTTAAATVCNDVKPERPLLRYHGGKWRLAPWIIGHFPAHRVYCEPFGGGGSVLLRKPRSKAEIYNDLDGEVVNVFRVVRDHGEELVRRLWLTPFARAEFDASYTPVSCPIERARLTIVRSFQGFGSNATSGQATGFRSNSNRSYTTPAHDWMAFPDKLRTLVERMRGVVIEERDALEVMRRHDSATTLHYVDPPYVHSTRSRAKSSSKRGYRHELTDQQHRELADVLAGLAGHVILSGYRCPLYDELYSGWQRIDRAAMADGARPRIESLWLSPGCGQHGLFTTQDGNQ